MNWHHQRYKRKLKGTHIYELHIDRINANVRMSQKVPLPWKGITFYADFTFTKEKGEVYKSMKSRELTNTDKAKQIKKLWPSYITKTLSNNRSYFWVWCRRSGECQAEIQNNPSGKEKKQNTENNSKNNCTTNNADNVSPKCETFFLRKGCLLKHITLCPGGSKELK